MKRFIPHLTLLFVATQMSVAAPDSFELNWKNTPNQIWTGEQTWANRLQDWRVEGGVLQCVPNRNLPFRTLSLLSHDLSGKGTGLEMSVTLGRITSKESNQADGAAGFVIGTGNGVMDYRAAALIHQTPGAGAGIFVGIDHLGRVLIHDNESGLYNEAAPIAVSSKGKSDFDFSHVKLTCTAKPAMDGMWNVTVKATGQDGNMIAETSGKVPAIRFAGNVGLTADPGHKKNSITHFWFSDWKGTGGRLQAHSDRSMGPVVGTHYTVSRKILKVSAQMIPLPTNRQKGATLEIKEDGKWKVIATSDVDSASYTAVFRIENWDDSKEVAYRVTAPKTSGNEKPWSGIIRKNPKDQKVFTVGAFTGNHNLSREVSAPGRYKKGHKGNWLKGTWFPHTEVCENVLAQSPDLLFFSGDQVYESASPSFSDGKARELDYLYKWYLYMWAFREMTCDIPSVVIPDDHDVYQGNFWGQSGRHAARQNDGGYTNPASFVQLVERTQVSNLPDPVDPKPVEQGIKVYFTALNWGHMSFAVIEDRKFKTGPDSEEAKSGDLSNLVLLGKRQLDFLEHWAGDWSDGAEMKASLTATIFSQLHTWRTKSGGIEQDPDTNGWPVEGRNKALRVLRKGYTVMIGGDQHLATTAHQGVDEQGDSGWSICVPSIANYFPRSWKPKTVGANRTPGMAENLGDFLDPWGNKVRVLAVANPTPKKPGDREPAALHDKVPGYGIIRFDTDSRKIELANWPRYATKGNGSPYAGWPITVSQKSNYGRKATAWLPELKISGMKTPVVQIFEKSTGELVYALRLKDDHMLPGVFKPGTYIVKVGEPDTKMWAIRTLEAKTDKSQKPIQLDKKDFTPSPKEK